MTSTKYFKKIKAQLKEEDNSYNSAFDAMLPNEQEQADLLSTPAETIDQDTEVKKEKLTAKAIDKIKQTLDVSDELQAILSEIDKINKNTHDNTWEANKEQNTAILPSKNAQIFIQNDNICLSMNGKVEIFNNITELHDFLRKHNLPLPKNIKLHEAAPINGSLKDYLNRYRDRISVTEYPKEDYDLPSKGKASREEYIAAMKKGDTDIFKTDSGTFIRDINGNILKLGGEKKKHYTPAELQARNAAQKIKDAEIKAQAEKQKAYLNSPEYKAQLKLKNDKLIARLNKAVDDIKAHLDYVIHPQKYLYTQTMKDFLASFSPELDKVDNIQDPTEEKNALIDVLTKLFDKLFECNAVLTSTKPSEEIKTKATKTEDCTVGTALNTPVQYQASSEEKLNEEELEERKPSDAGFVGDFLTDKSGNIVDYGTPSDEKKRWVDTDITKHSERLGNTWLDWVRPKDPEGKIKKGDLPFLPEKDPHFWTNANAYRDFAKARKSELVGSSWDDFWAKWVNRNPNSDSFGRIISTPEQLQQARSYEQNGKVYTFDVEMMTKEKLANIANEFKELGIDSLYGDIDPDDPELFTKFVPIKTKIPTNARTDAKNVYAAKVSPHIDTLKYQWFDARELQGKKKAHKSDVQYVADFLKAHPELEKTHSYKLSARNIINQKLIGDEQLDPTVTRKKDTKLQKIENDKLDKQYGKAKTLANLQDDNALYKAYKRRYNDSSESRTDITKDIENLKPQYRLNDETKQAWNLFIDNLIADAEANDVDKINIDKTSLTKLKTLKYTGMEDLTDTEINQDTLAKAKSQQKLKNIYKTNTSTITSGNTKATNATKLYDKFTKEYNNTESPLLVTMEIAKLQPQYAATDSTKAEWNEFINELLDNYKKAYIDNNEGDEDAPDLDETSYSALLPKLLFPTTSQNKESTATSFGQAFLNLQKKEDLSLKEDDSPADFATGQSAAPDISAGVDMNATDTTTAATDTTTQATPDMGMDPMGGAAPNPQFGDIQINAGGGDYSPDDPNAQAQMPAPDMPEYKIIDVLVNDKDISDIKVKVKDKKTGEILTKNLSEIDV